MNQKGFIPVIVIGGTILLVLLVVGTSAIFLHRGLITATYHLQQGHEAIAKARNLKRKMDLQSINSALHLYIQDNMNTSLDIPSTDTPISKNGLNLCQILIPQYINALPVDPSGPPNGYINNCSTNYDTKYTIKQIRNIITLNAPLAELGEVISTTASVSATSAQSPSETANWKTYTDTVGGFSLMYPPEMQPSTGFGVQLVLHGSPLQPDQTEEFDELDLTFTIYNTDSIASAMQSNLKYYQNVTNEPYVIQTKQLNSTVSAKQLIVHFGTDGVFENIYTYINLLNGKVLEIHSDWSSQNSQKYEALSNQILFTFKFLNPTPPPSISCLPRPACLDAIPRCMIAEPANGWCKS